MTKNLNNDESKDHSREPFRPVNRIDHISEFMGHEEIDKNYIYQPVIYNYPGALANNFDVYEKAGWEVVYSKKCFKDDRMFSPSHGQTDSLRPQPVLRTTRDGYHEILMRIHKDKWQEHAHKKAKQEIENYLRAVGHDAHSVGKHMKGVYDNLKHIDLTDKHETIIKPSGDK